MLVAVDGNEDILKITAYLPRLQNQWRSFYSSFILHLAISVLEQATDNRRSNV
jgi:hypothetical protein